MFEGMTLLLLHDKGAKSGKPYIHPLAYYGDDGRYVIFASKGGAPENPAWYHNVKAHPDVRIEVGTEAFDVDRHRADRRGARAGVPRPGRARPAVRRVREEHGRARSR